MITNTAFEFLRQHKQVSAETETLVMKRVRGRVTMDELLGIFEKGIVGEYGKVYSLDPQTLVSWVEAHLRVKNNAKNYLESGLLPPSTPITSLAYPQSINDWRKEINKAYNAFSKGVSEDNFHPDIFQNLWNDKRVNGDEFKKYVPENYPECEDWQITKGMQLAIRDYFKECKAKGWSTIYFI